MLSGPLLLLSGDQFIFWKLLLVAACAIVLFLMMKTLSSSERLDTPQLTAFETSYNVEPGLPQEQRFRGEEAPKAKDLGPVSVLRFNFSQFNAIPGPPDPERFADELILELYDPANDHRWSTSFVVATPSGISQLMQQERWAFFYASEIFIVQRYDLKLIQEAVYGRINEVRQQVGAERDAPIAD